MFNRLPEDPDEILTLGPCPLHGHRVEIRAKHFVAIVGLAQGIHQSTDLSINIDNFSLPGVDWTDWDVPRSALLRVAVSAENHSPLI